MTKKKYGRPVGLPVSRSDLVVADDSEKVVFNLEDGEELSLLQHALGLAEV